MANEQDQLPCRKVVDARSSEGRHSGHANAVLDDCVKLAIALALGCSETQIGRWGIEAVSIHRVAVSVVGVTTCTVIGEVISRFRQSFGRRRNWVSQARFSGSRCGSQRFRCHWASDAQRNHLAAKAQLL